MILEGIMRRNSFRFDEVLPRHSTAPIYKAGSFNDFEKIYLQNASILWEKERNETTGMKLDFKLQVIKFSKK